jgi:ATP phosphoribosyltransferase
MLNGNLKLAVQKKGRLSEKSLQLLKSCGLEIEDYSEKLLISARNYKLDILFLRDDDIPEYVQDGVADIGIVGEDVLYERDAETNVIKKLGFGKCSLALALPENKELNSIKDLHGMRIATSYPKLLKKYLVENNIEAKVVEISGSVEIAPSLGVADLICDLVSTGTTLKLNKLKKSFDVFSSEAVLIANRKLFDNPDKKILIDNLIVRMDSAIQAKRSKYLMMNLPKSSLNMISEIIPSLKSPTIVPLADESLIAVHAVIPADKFWDIYKELKDAGASGILLLPIENIIL